MVLASTIWGFSGVTDRYCVFLVTVTVVLRSYLGLLTEVLEACLQFLGKKAAGRSSFASGSRPRLLFQPLRVGSQIVFLYGHGFHWVGGLEWEGRGWHEWVRPRQRGKAHSPSWQLLIESRLEACPSQACGVSRSHTTEVAFGIVVSWALMPVASA